MKRLPIILILALAAFVAVTGCDRKKSGPAVQPPPAAKRTEWTADQISKDPEGYLHWSDQQVVEHIAANNKRLADLQASRARFAEKRDMLIANVKDVENVRKRLEEAVQRAEDEDRWPVRMGTYSFNRQKAQEILKQTLQYIEERQPTAAKYDEFLGKLDNAVGAVRTDNARLDELRDKLALDLESVRVNKGIAEVDKLRTAESQLRQMATAVATLNDDNDPLKSSLPGEPPPPPGRVNIDEILK